MDLYTVRQQLNLGTPLTKIKLRVTAYSRVSTEHDEQKSSLQNQKNHFEKMIKNNPNWTYINSYVDEGISGTSDLKRNNFMRMIDDAKKQRFDLIITKEISRFSRNTLDSIKYTRELLTYGVAVLFINDNINTALPDSELRLTIMSSLAQDEIRRLSERVKFGMNESINKGNILGNNMLYGYKKDQNTGNLNIIKAEAEVIKRLFSLYAIHQKSLNEIANIFNKENIKTNQNKKWSPTTLSRMIKNVKYKGYYCGKKSEVIDYMTKKIKHLPMKDWIIYKDTKKIPPIIEETLWEKANKRLKQKSKKKRQSEEKYIYSSKIYCKCHNTLFYRRKQCKKTDDSTWLCSEYLTKGKSYCNSPNIREKELDYILKDIFSKTIIDLSKVKRILLKIYKKEQQSNINTKKLLEDKSLIKRKKDKLFELIVNKDISNEEFKEKNDSLNRMLEEVTEKLKKATVDNLPNNKLEHLIDKKLTSKNTFKNIVSLLLEKIVVSKENDDISLIIYMRYKIANVISYNYSFKRGYNTKGTKRYKVIYKVQCINI